MRKKFQISVLILFTWIATLPAQSYFGSGPGSFGIRKYVTGIRGQGMGNVALALPDSVAPSAYGITQWGFIRHSRIVIGGEYFITRTNVDNFSFNRASAGLHNVVLIIPLISYKWHLGFTLAPYAVNNIAFIRQFSTPLTSYREITSRLANLGKAQFATAWSPAPQISIGVAYNYYFGVNITEYKILFDEGNFNDIRIQDEYEVRGSNLGFYLGMNSIPGVRLTGFIETAPNATARRTYRYSFAGKVTVSQTEDKDATIPTQMGLGVSFTIGQHLTIASDFVYQNWRNGFGITQHTAEIGPEWYHFGTGIELGAKRERHTALLRRLDWRLGVSVDNLGYKYAGNNVYQYALHLGTGIPFFFGYNRLDIALRLGSRGDQNLKNVRENFIELNFGVSLGEKWFQRIR